MTRFSHFYVLAIGAFIIAGAHYVRNGDDIWYVVWICTAVLLTLAGRSSDNWSETAGRAPQ